MKATTNNTIFVTAATERTQNFLVVMSTARKNDIFVHVLTSDAFPPDYWGMKMRPLHEYLRVQKAAGKEYVLFFDAYDVIFLAHRDEIITRLNELYDGRVIFNADYPRSLYPYTRHDYLFAHEPEKAFWLIDHIQNGDTETSRLLNSGLFTGHIDDVLKLFDAVADVKKRFVQRTLSSPFTDRLYEDISAKKFHIDDQMSFWMTMIHYPELIRVDSHKEFLSVAATKFMLDGELENYRKVTRDRPIKDGTCIGNALVVHSAGGNWRNMGFVWQHQLYEPISFHNAIRSTEQ